MMFRRNKTARLSRRPELLLRRLEDRILFDAAPGIAADVPPEDFQQPQETAQSLDGTSDQQQTTRHELVFVDTSLEGYQQLVDDVLQQGAAERMLELVLLDADANGVEQISAVLDRADNVNAIHIVSHADEAAFRLGDEWITANNLSTYAPQLASWKGGLAEEADLLIYGCDFSGSPAGQTLAQELSELTGADVASSSDDTGHALLGGDWELEQATGSIETNSAFSEAARGAFVGLLAVGPNVQVSLPAETMIGEQFTFNVTFQNTGAPGEVGYGPFVDLIFPVNGLDGAAGTDTPDGIDFTGATYLGAAVTATEFIFPDDGGGVGSVDHPYAVDNTGAPLQVSGTAGDKLVVLQLPFGSFTPEQPDASLAIGATLSDHADLGAPLSIAARAGFQYGADSLSNPATDPSILSDIQSDSSAWTVSDAVTPTLMTLTKTYQGPENETATGPSYVRQYQLNIELADGQTVTDLDLIDQLPNNIVVTGIDSITPAGTVTNPSGFPYGPVNPLPANTLAVNLPSVTGGAGIDAQVVFSFYVNEFDADGGRVIPLNSTLR